jgi:hypothetical protein
MYLRFLKKPVLKHLDRTVYSAVVGVPEGKTPRGKPQLKFDEVIEVNLKDIQLEVMSENWDQAGLL